jgi:hypothetical protein
MSILRMGRNGICTYIYIYTRTAPKVMPPILLCWPTRSEANIVDMAVEVEPSCQYSVKFCCRATDDSRGAV